MEDNAYQAIVMSFAMFVFVIALSATMALFSKLTETSEILTFKTDETNYYDNVEVVGTEGIERYVNTETVIPTLYRYYKENFCVKIYDTTNTNSNGSSPTNPVLIQILDVNLEGKVENASKINNLRSQRGKLEFYEAYSLNEIYNNQSSLVYMFGVPWLDSTDNMKLRLDYFINGSAGYINNRLVDYTQNPFNAMVKKTQDVQYQFKEKFISYSYTGETMTTDDGDVLVTGASAKDKIVITYTLVRLDAENNEKINAIKNK